MNIHITNKTLFESLKLATIAKVRIGSHIYKTNNKDSDEDFLYIYATSINESNSPFKVHHQLQYKENNIDYNFVSLHNFIHNCINGDSTINFEVIFSDELEGTSLEFITKDDIKNNLISYTIIKSYLGLARRDVKHINKYKDDYNRKKRLGHIIRGYIYANQMIEHSFDFNVCNKFFKNIIDDISVSEYNNYLNTYSKNIDELRKELNNKFNIGKLGLPKILNVETAIKIESEILNLCESDYYKDKQMRLKDFDTSIFIDSLENWVSY
jgi:predicted nucleotidyltransferase